MMAHGFSGFDPYTPLYGPAHRINLTHPQWSQMLTAPLAKQAGGLGLCRSADGRPFIFKTKTDPDYRAILKALEHGRQTLEDHPRVDMSAQYSESR